jgi:hypothetical protein
MGVVHSPKKIRPLILGQFTNKSKAISITDHKSISTAVKLAASKQKRSAKENSASDEPAEHKY